MAAQKPASARSPLPMRCLNGTRPDLVKEILAPLAGDLRRWVAGASPAAALEKLTQTSDARPDTGGTNNDLFDQHASDPKCAGCHTLMDPIGKALGNFASGGCALLVA